MPSRRSRRMDVIKYFPRKTSHFTPRARTYQPPRAMDCCDDEPCRTVRGGPFSLPEKRNSIPGSSSGRLQPVPLGDVTNANPSLRAPPDRASRPAAAAVTGASQSDGPKWIIPGIWKWTSPEEKKDHRAAREIGWTEKRQKGWSDNFTEEERSSSTDDSTLRMSSTRFSNHRSAVRASRRSGAMSPRYTFSASSISPGRRTTRRTPLARTSFKEIFWRLLTAA